MAGLKPRLVKVGKVSAGVSGQGVIPDTLFVIYRNANGLT